MLVQGDLLGGLTKATGLKGQGRGATWRRPDTSRVRGLMPGALAKPLHPKSGLTPVACLRTDHRASFSDSEPLLH